MAAVLPGFNTRGWVSAFEIVDTEKANYPVSLRCEAVGFRAVVTTRGSMPNHHSDRNRTTVCLSRFERCTRSACSPQSSGARLHCQRGIKSLGAQSPLCRDVYRRRAWTLGAVSSDRGLSALKVRCDIGSLLPPSSRFVFHTSVPATRHCYRDHIPSTDW